MPASPPDYADIEIRIDPLRGNSYPVTLVVDGARQYPGRMDKSILPWLASYSPEQDGERLFGQLFADPNLRAAWGEARGKVRSRIRLVISQDAPELHAIPWELLREHILPYPPVTLAAAGDTPFSRYLYGGWEPGQPVQTRPVRMLVAVANPDGLAKLGLTPIDVDKEWQLVQEAASHPGMKLELLPQPCTLAALADKLAEGFHILHLVCHGSFADELGIAALYLADGTNQVVRVHDDELVAALRNRLPAVPEKDRLRLIFLASCETATRSPADAFRGLAPKLVRAGVPVVLAMQDKVPVRTAQAFAGTFYEKLLQHGLVDLACNQARAHVIAERLPGPSIPVLFMRLRDGRLLEVRSSEEIAYLNRVIAEYQEYEETYTPLAGIVEQRKPVAKGPRLKLSDRFMPTEFEKLVEHGFGAERETERVPIHDLRQAVTKFRRLVLLGEPGSGKTTTLRRLSYDYAVAARTDTQAPLPLLVPLGAYTGPESALAYVQSHAGALAASLPAYLSNNRAVLLLDGLNEMPSQRYKERVGRIQTLLDQYPDAMVVVTCRALDYVETLRLQKLEVKPLDRDQQHAYLCRYLETAEGDRLFWLMAGDEIAGLWHLWRETGASWEQFWETGDIPHAVSNYATGKQLELWKQLQAGWLPPLWTLGQNPLMLIMLAQVYVGTGTIPQNRGRLFAAFVDTLLERQRQRTDPELWPGSAVIQSSLARLAFAMQSAGERGTAVERAWAVKQLHAGVDPEHLLYLAASAMVLDTSGGRVRFIHQLILEYFTAAALAEQLEEGKDLRSYWPKGWVDPSGWEETAILLAGLLPDMTPLVKQLLVANPPLAARCIVESGGERPADATVQAVQQRLMELMLDPAVDIPQRDAAGVAINYLGDPRPGVGLRTDGLPDISWVFVPDKDPQSGHREFIYGESEEPRTEPDFWIARYLITYVQFQAFLDAADGFGNARWWQGLAASEEHRTAAFEQWFRHENHPRDSVSWYDAIAFCRWLTEKAKEHLELLPKGMDRGRGWKITLPTEWQWEKAARGHDGRRYPWGGNDYKSGYANIDEMHNKVGKHYLQKTSAVGMYPQGVSPYGVADLSGNVLEWCLNEYSNPERVQLEGDDWRVLRGGSWDDSHSMTTAPFRYDHLPDTRYYVYGFRVVVVG